MVIMALDHARDFFHISAGIDDPLNLATTTPLLYFTRWITHFCAPIFIFLSGTSIYLQSLRKTKKELSSFLIKRGLWLIFVEVFLISLGWTFNPNYHFIPLQVIWAIGISMFLLGILIHLPFKIILTFGFAIVLGHNLLDFPESAPGFTPDFWWDLLHHGNFSPYPLSQNHLIIIVYPFLPWTGLMMLGYCAGIFFTEKYSPVQRRKIFTGIGMGLLLVFFFLRLSNAYGDPHLWSTQKNDLTTVFSFLKVEKYPPSLLFLSIFIGIGFLLLAWFENIKNGFSQVMRTYGRVAFFYYVIHLYLIHFVAVILFFSRGHSFQEVDHAGQFPFYFVVPGEGSGLGWVYLLWIMVIVGLYPLCRWYDTYKTWHKEKWWLSYW